MRIRNWEEERGRVRATRPLMIRTRVMILNEKKKGFGSIFERVSFFSATRLKIREEVGYGGDNASEDRPAKKRVGWLMYVIELTNYYFLVLNLNRIRLNSNAFTLRTLTYQLRKIRNLKPGNNKLLRTQWNWFRQIPRLYEKWLFLNIDLNDINSKTEQFTINFKSEASIIFNIINMNFTSCWNIFNQLKFEDPNFYSLPIY
jgi:hypothetical protein